MGAFSSEKLTLRTWSIKTQFFYPLEFSTFHAYLICHFYSSSSQSSLRDLSHDLGITLNTDLARCMGAFSKHLLNEKEYHRHLPRKIC